MFARSTVFDHPLFGWSKSFALLRLMRTASWPHAAQRLHPLRRNGRATALPSARLVHCAQLHRLHAQACCSTLRSGPDQGMPPASKRPLSRTCRCRLRAAALYGDTVDATAAIAEGADVNSRDQHGWSPLHWAATGARRISRRRWGRSSQGRPNRQSNAPG